MLQLRTKKVAGIIFERKLEPFKLVSVGTWRCDEVLKGEFTREDIESCVHTRLVLSEVQGKAANFKIQGITHDQNGDISVLAYSELVRHFKHFFPVT